MNKLSFESVKYKIEKQVYEHVYVQLCMQVNAQVRSQVFGETKPLSFFEIEPN